MSDPIPTLEQAIGETQASIAGNPEAEGEAHFCRLLLFCFVIPAKAGIQLAGVGPHKTHVAADAALTGFPPSRE